MHKGIERVLVTRQPEQSVEFINLLSTNGFYPFLLPLIETVQLSNLPKHNYYDYIIFTSGNAVIYSLHFLRVLKYENLVAVGEKTKSQLEYYGFNVDIVPEEFSAKGLMNFFDTQDIESKSILIPTTKIAKDDLANYLKDRGCLVERCFVYDTIEKIYAKGYLEDFIKRFRIEVITFASPSAARSFFKQINDLDLKNYLFVAIGNVTAKELKGYGVECIYPDRYTINDLVNLLIKIKTSGG